MKNQSLETGSPASTIKESEVREMNIIPANDRLKEYNGSITKVKGSIKFRILKKFDDIVMNYKLDDSNLIKKFCPTSLFCGQSWLIYGRELFPVQDLGSAEVGGSSGKNIKKIKKFV